MELRTDVIDVSVFRRGPDGVRYLLLHTSQEKADRWFGGGRFWQIPDAFLEKDETVVAAAGRCLRELGFSASALWVVEHVYPIYYRRTGGLVLIPVFAAEVGHTGEMRLGWEHSEAKWYTSDECRQRLTFRGLLGGLDWVRRYITENEAPRPEFRLAQPKDRRECRRGIAAQRRRP